VRTRISTRGSARAACGHRAAARITAIALLSIRDDLVVKNFAAPR
jgi:hypothetical protein